MDIMNILCIVNGCAGIWFSRAEKTYLKTLAQEVNLSQYHRMLTCAGADDQHNLARKITMFYWKQAQTHIEVLTGVDEKAYDLHQSHLS